jgi:hypothetical protein
MKVSLFLAVVMLHSCYVYPIILTFNVMQLIWGKLFVYLKRGRPGIIEAIRSYENAVSPPPSLRRYCFFQKKKNSPKFALPQNADGEQEKNLPSLRLTSPCSMVCIFELKRKTEPPVTNIKTS